MALNDININFCIIHLYVDKIKINCEIIKTS